jgi:hypothetical protein
VGLEAPAPEAVLVPVAPVVGEVAVALPTIRQRSLHKAGQLLSSFLRTQTIAVSAVRSYLPP